MPRRHAARRRRIAVAAILLGLCGAGALWTLVVEPQWIVVTRTTIPITDLPEEFEGITIALVADTHHGPWTGKGFVRRVARRTSREKPDIVALAGDFIHYSARYAEPGIEPLGGIEAPLGTYAVLGNHDHWEGAEAVRAALRRHGIAILENAHAIVERGGAKLCIAGIQEIWEGAPDVSEALAGVDPDVPRVLIVHNPDFVDTLGDTPRVDLVLAGHTHGGQVVLPFVGPLILPARKEYAAGLVNLPHGLLYVTRGASEITPPVRLGCRPEIAILTLVRAKGSP
ncbi:MAG: metallophosphoesterase [Deltaproteobacteria bacterium]|nr:metallophosphoesterase [Deltaproteobacteria bacterium]